jgi:hypothetical protein
VTERKEIVEKVLRMWLTSGLTASKISDRINADHPNLERKFTRNAVIGIAHRAEDRKNGIKRPRHVAETPRAYVRPKVQTPAVSPLKPMVTLAVLRLNHAVAHSNASAHTRLYDLPLLELNDDGCKWPTESQGTTHKFCNCPKRGDSSYCEAHWQASYQPRKAAPMGSARRW